MNLHLNGQPLETHCTTVRELLIEQGLDTVQSGIAVAVNSEVVSRADWERVAINDGDHVEVITAMQGG